MPKTDGYYIRAYRRGDEKKLTALFNEVYQDYAGFVPRTIKYWTWAILSRPDLSKEGIAIVINTDQVVGYAAINKSGNILEFCYDPNCEGKKIVSTLLEWCIDYVEEQGASSICLNAPVQDKLIRQVCEELGFTEEPFSSLILRILDLPHILKKIRNQEKKKLRKSYDETISINLTKFPPWCAQHVDISVHEGEMTFSTERLKQSTIKIDVDISTISSCVFSSKWNLYRAILERRLKIRPLRKILKAVKILSLIQLKNPPWYVPIADYG